MATKMKRPAKPAKAPRGKGKNVELPTEDWYADAAELPRADLSANQANLAKRNRYRWMFNVALFSVPLALIACVLAFGALNAARIEARAAGAGGNTQVAQAVIDRVTSPGRYAATQAMTEWLSSVPSPLPGGSIQSWNGSKQVQVQVQEAGQDGQPTVAATQPIVTLEQFTVIDGTGRGYRAEVEVVTDPRGGSTVMAGPSLEPLPMPVSGAFADLPIWDGVNTESTVPATLTSAADAWAQAYTSGDPERLRLAVGDTNAGRSYIPIAGVSRVTSEVTHRGTVIREEGGEDVRYALARVEVSMNWLGRRDSASPAPMVMDLLIAKPDTAAPQVVAWGSPGSGPGLNPFQNAIPTQQRVTAPTLNPTQTPKTAPVDDGGIAPSDAPTETAGN